MSKAIDFPRRAQDHADGLNEVFPKKASKVCRGKCARTTINVAVPRAGTDLKSFFAQLVEDDVGDICGDLVPALDLDLSNDRENLDGVEIDSVEIKDMKVFVYYYVAYSAHFGCRDMDYAERECRTLTGRIKNKFFVFDVHTPAERSTFEEF